MASLDGRSLSNTNLVNDLRADDLLPIVRTSEPLPQDQNAHMSGARLKELLGAGGAAGTPAPAMNLYAGPGTHTDGPMNQKATTDYGNRGANLTAGGYAAVTVLSQASIGYAAGMATRAELDPTKLFLGSVCRAEFTDATDGTRNQGATYRLTYDPAGTLLVYRDGSLSGARDQPASWVDIAGPAAVRANIRAITATMPTPAFVLGEVGTYTRAAIEGFYRYLAPAGGTYAAPTASIDANWEQVAPPTAPAALYQSIPYAVAVRAATAGTLAAGREYLITGRPDSTPNVRGTFSSFTPPFMQYAVLEGQPGAYSYDLTSDTATALLNSAAYYTSTQLQQFSSLLAAVQAQDAEMVAAGAVAATSALYLNRPGGLTGLPALPATRFFPVGNLFSDQMYIILPTSGLNILGATRIRFLSGPAYLYPNGFQRLQDGSASNLVFMAGTATTLTLTNFIVAAWSNPGGTGTPCTVTLEGTTNAPPAPYPAGITVVDKRPVADTFSVLPYAASIAVDFNAETVRTLAATGNVAYGASVNVALLKTQEHYITNTTGAPISLSFPAGWKFTNASRPTTLAAGAEAVLTLRSLGTTDATMKAAYAVLG